MDPLAAHLLAGMTGLIIGLLLILVFDLGYDKRQAKRRKKEDKAWGERQRIHDMQKERYGNV